jgi:hypothetical protein
MIGAYSQFQLSLQPYSFWPGQVSLLKVGRPLMAAELAGRESSSREMLSSLSQLMHHLSTAPLSGSSVFWSAIKSEIKDPL